MHLDHSSIAWCISITLSISIPFDKRIRRSSSINISLKYEELIGKNNAIHDEPHYRKVERGLVDLVSLASFEFSIAFKYK